MKRGARFFVLDQGNPQNKDADYIVLDVPPAALAPLIAQLENYKRITEMDPSRRAFKRGGKEVWSVHLYVEASHPKGTADKEGKIHHPPSLLKESIPRAGGS
ncbi:MAG TPA: hypothetical protein VFA98_06375 [Thermoanaerobaculia bacterium]|jgi:hypothetical protein|nr:hypothetical protein [Thermoanaerobaculia bacterium]